LLPGDENEDRQDGSRSPSGTLKKPSEVARAGKLQSHQEREADDEGRLDELLAKIQREGMQSLTDEERSFLEHFPDEYRKRSPEESPDAVKVRFVKQLTELKALYDGGPIKHSWAGALGFIILGALWIVLWLVIAITYNPCGYVIWLLGPWIWYSGLRWWLEDRRRATEWKNKIAAKASAVIQEFPELVRSMGGPPALRDRDTIWEWLCTTGRIKRTLWY
jgi:hypothetical protein